MKLNITFSHAIDLLTQGSDLIFKSLQKKTKRKELYTVAPGPGNFLKHRKINWKASHLLTAERLENDERRTAFILTGTST